MKITFFHYTFLFILNLLFVDHVKAQCKYAIDDLFAIPLSQDNFKVLKGQYKIDSSLQSGTIKPMRIGKSPFAMHRADSLLLLYVFSANKPNQYIVDNIAGVQPYQHFVLSFDIKLLTTINPPNIYVALNNKDTTYIPNNIADVWQHFEMEYNNDFSFIMDMKMLNINYEQAGNDFVLRNLSLKQCRNYQPVSIPRAKFKGRSVSNSATKKFSSDSVEIRVFEFYRYEHEKVDLYLNGKLLAKKIRIEPNAKGYKVKLNERYNELIIHSRRQGFPPPCTGFIGILGKGDENYINSFVVNRKRSTSVWIECEKFEF